MSLGGPWGSFLGSWMVQNHGRYDYFGLGADPVKTVDWSCIVYRDSTVYAANTVNHNSQCKCYQTDCQCLSLPRKDVLEQKFRKVVEEIGLTKKIGYKVNILKLSPSLPHLPLNFNHQPI